MDFQPVFYQLLYFACLLQGTEKTVRKQRSDRGTQSPLTYAWIQDSGGVCLNPELDGHVAEIYKGE